MFIPQSYPGQSNLPISNLLANMHHAFPSRPCVILQKTVLASSHNTPKISISNYAVPCQITPIYAFFPDRYAVIISLNHHVKQ